jgi:hypothetical protein
VDNQCVNEPKLCAATDACLTAACVNGQCQETPVVGVVSDGLAEVLEGQQIFRSALASAGGRFYSATYGRFGLANDLASDVVMRSYDFSSNSWLKEGRFRDILNADNSVGSAVSLIPSSRPLFPLNTYAAVSSPSNVNGRLVRLQFDKDFEISDTFPPQLTTDPDYFLSDADAVGPSAGQLRSRETFVVWPGGSPTNPGVYLQVGDRVADTSTGPMFPAAVRDISGLAVISGGDQPGAVWMSDGLAGVSLQAGIDGNAMPTEVIQCDKALGYQGYELDVDNSVDDLWTVAWTKKLGDSYIGELSAIRCSDDGCQDLTTTGADLRCSRAQIASRVFPGVSALVTRTMRRSERVVGDVLYQAVLAAGRNGADARLELRLNRIELNAQDKSELVGEPVVFSSGASAQAARNPQIVLLPPDQLAVSWIEPKGGGTGDELHVQRHRICFKP